MMRNNEMYWGLKLLILFLLLISAFLSTTALAVEGSKWSGVDEAVVEKVAKEHGREASTPIINMEQGDLPLFMFLIAGTVGGFIAGYYWRTLIAEGRSNEQKSNGSHTGAAY